MNTKEIIIDTLTIDNSLESKQIIAKDITLDGISVKDCISALSTLSNSVDIEIDGEDYNLVGIKI